MVWGRMLARHTASPEAGLDVGSKVRAGGVHRHCGSGGFVVFTDTVALEGWGPVPARHAARTRKAQEACAAHTKANTLGRLSVCIASPYARPDSGNTVRTG